MSATCNYPQPCSWHPAGLLRNEERRTRPERWRWNRRAATLASLEPRDRAAHVIARPYLLAHPEREIAAAGTHIGVAYCAACDITYKAPAIIPFESVGLMVECAYHFIAEHNALIHPRRAARLTK